MGSRAVVIVCRRRAGGAGAVRRCRRRDRASSTPARAAVSSPIRSWRPQFLARIRAAMDASGFWTQFNTDWACLDCELMPWSAKAQELLRSQYAAVGAAGRASLPKVVAALQQASERLAVRGCRPGQSSYSSDIDGLLRRSREPMQAIGQFVAAYRQYCWPVESLDDLKLAPFHLLATEGKVYTDQDHVWHMETLAAICRHDPRLAARNAVQGRRSDRPRKRRGGHRLVAGTHRAGGEGMVVKPHAVHCQRSQGSRPTGGEVPGPGVPADHLRPGVHVPGEPVATAAARSGDQAVPGPAGVRPGRRGPGTLRAREPLRRVHECVFGVLALESEPVDPRL